MDKLEDKIRLEYYRIYDIMGFAPKYLFISLEFYKYLHENCKNIRQDLNFETYKDMIVKRSLDLKYDEFLFSFDKYQL